MKDKHAFRLKLKNIKRHQFEIYPAPVTVAKGPRDEEVERILTPLINKLKANGTYQKTLGPVLDKPFVEWDE
jgi:hypothetical protein